MLSSGEVKGKKENRSRNKKKKPRKKSEKRKKIPINTFKYILMKMY